MIQPHEITVLLAEDHSIVRAGITALLNSETGFKIVGEARNGREAVKMAAELRPSIVVMDIAMPVLNGMEATRQIMAHNPQAKIVILSAHSDPEYVKHVRAGGAAGFIEKQTSAEVLTKALREVAAGRSFYSASIAKQLRDDPANALDRKGLAKANATRLTSREAEVLQLVAEGAANKQVASILDISVKTVEKHRQHLMDKLNIHDTAGLTRYAISAGFIQCGVKLTIV